MDIYGCLNLTLRDAKLVRQALEQNGAVVFPLTSDHVGCMIITLTAGFAKIGIMPFGGRPDGRIYVGVYGRGCNHFSAKPTEPGYFGEKLNIQGQDAKTLSDFWKMMWNKEEEHVAN